MCRTPRWCVGTSILTLVLLLVLHAKFRPVLLTFDPSCQIVGSSLVCVR